MMFNECLEISWKTTHFCIVNFSSWNHFVWEIISKHSTVCFITSWNTLKFVKNTLLHVIFSILFSVFHLVMKQVACFPCLIYYVQVISSATQWLSNYGNIFFIIIIFMTFFAPWTVVFCLSCPSQSATF